MRIIILALLTLGYASAQVDRECDIPETCSDSDLDDDADFDATVPFPEKPYLKALEKNETILTVVNTYDPRDIEPVSRILVANWWTMCPVFGYTIYRWSFWQPNVGRCYSITPIRATRCATRYCKHIVSSPFLKYYRCYPYYRKVYFWAYCPTIDSQFPFIFTSRYIAGGCNCRRYFCPLVPTVA